MDTFNELLLDFEYVRHELAETGDRDGLLDLLNLATQQLVEQAAFVADLARTTGAACAAEAELALEAAELAFAWVDAETAPAH